MQTDVLVVGGGTGGVTAALSAARRGAQVILAERDGALGGVATRAGIHIYYHGRSAGVQKEIDAQTRALGKELGGKPPGFHPEARRLVVYELLHAAGCKVVFHAVACEVLAEGNRILGVVFETPEGPLRIAAQVTVDATGDADVCALAGVPFTYGRDWDGVTNNYSLVPRYLNEGRIALWNFDGGWVDSTSVEDVSRVCLEGRRRLRERMGTDLTPEILVSVAPQIGIREGRLVEGEYRLTLADLAAGRRFPDAVMQCQAHYDTHAYDYANENILAQVWTCVMGLWKQPIGCDVPFRSFIPRGFDGLLVGCRAVSQTRDASLAFRMQRDIQQAGEVAGTAAALSVLSGCEPRAIDIAHLQQWLVEQGVLDEAEMGSEEKQWAQLAPDDERTATPADPIAWLISRLGTHEEGTALWCLWQTGEAAVQPLLARLAEEQGAVEARGIALALALLGRKDGVPHLIRAVVNRDQDGLPGNRTSARWIGCLIALRLLGNASVAKHVANKLPDESDSGVALHILHYLFSVGDKMPVSDQDTIVASVQTFLSRQDLGDDYVMWGGVRESLRWSLELTAAPLLALLDRAEQAKGIVARYHADHRGFVRRAAALMAHRIHHIHLNEARSIAP